MPSVTNILSPSLSKTTAMSGIIEIRRPPQNTPQDTTEMPRKPPNTRKRTKNAENFNKIRSPVTKINVE